MPPLILCIQKAIDISVYSSIRLSISNDIPWLCVDSFLADIFVHSRWQQVNTFKLFVELGHLLSFEQKKDGLYLYAQETLPYVLTYRDLRLLSIADDKYAHYFLAKILFLYPKAFSDTKTAVRILIDILTPVLAKAYIKGEILNGLRVQNPRNDGYAERVFNACCHLSMQCNDGNTAERKLAMLLCGLFLRFYNAFLMQKLISGMAFEFAQGHFMDISMINAGIEEEMLLIK